MAKKNYYDILGISEHASDDEVKKAYRKIAVKYHPDKNPGDKKSEKIFMEATDAYEILKDQVKRARYDKKTPFKKKRKSARRGTDLRIKLNINREDLVYQKKQLIVIKRRGKCPQCNGTGSAIRKLEECRFCSGTGLQGFALVMGNKKRCSHCDGAGSYPEGVKCSRCKGVALVMETIHHEIELNPLSEYFTLKGLGNCSFCGETGDLFVDLNIKENPNYLVKGINVRKIIQISPAQAVLGDTLNLNVFKKELEIKIPAGVQNKHVIDVEKGGITYKGRTGFFRADINVKIPAIITEKEKELYKEILKTEKEASACPTTLTC
jgi:molecular chaperone DnaJ